MQCDPGEKVKVSPVIVDLSAPHFWSGGEQTSN
jgi:hypothetical protein